jgi:radical SAM superfamily enzyme YgiQ (UPF0313 family)
MKIVLTADRTNMPNHKIFLLTSFLSSIPREIIHPLGRWIYESIIFSKPLSSDREISYAFYGIRKIETALIEANITVEVVPWNKLDQIDNVDVFGVSATDPLGYGSSTNTARMFIGGTPYNRYYFENLLKKLKKFQKPIIVGGTGAWQFEIFPEEQKNLGIDCVIIGDGEEIAPKIFRMAADEIRLPKLIYANQPKQIPTIRKPAYWGLVEISRGCDRACQFCDPALKKFQWIPIDNILKEVKINLKIQRNITLHSEDVFRYGCKPGEWKPTEKVLNLLKAVKKEGAEWITITHGTLTSAYSSPNVIKEIARLMKSDPNDYSGIQIGLETGSPRLIEKYMRGKVLPYNSEDWPTIAVEAFKLLTENRIVPLTTILIGLPDEKEEDVEKTRDLVKQLEKYPSIIVPLVFVPLGHLKGQKFPKMLSSDVYLSLISTCARHNGYWTRRFANYWQGKISLGPRFLLQIGAMLMWNASEAIKTRKNISKLRIASWIAKEITLFGAQSIENMIS